MDSGLYFHGYDFSTGVLQLGAPCVAPIVQVSNTTDEELVVSWASRLPLPEASLTLQDELLQQSLVNTEVVRPGDSALISSLFPSSGPLLSVLVLSGASTETVVYVLNFTAERGYYFRRILKPCAFPDADERICTFDLLEGRVFLLKAAGAPQGSLWSNALVFPLRISKVPLTAYQPCLAVGGCYP